MKLGKSSMNYRNDLDECLIYFNLLILYAQFYDIILWVV